MDWVKLVIPLIALGIWILSNIVARTEQRRGGRSGPGLPPRPAPRTDERSPEEPGQEGAEELQRRINEARQRARERAEQLARERALREQAMREPAGQNRAEREKERDQERSQELDRRRQEQEFARRQAERSRRPAPMEKEEPQRTSRTRRAAEPILVLPPALESPPLATVVEVPLAQVVHEEQRGPKEAAQPRSHQAAVGAAAMRRQTQKNPALLSLLGMLRKRENLASAFLLKEVLDQPLCLRR